MSSFLNATVHEEDAPSIWYGHSLLTASLFPAEQPSEDTPAITKLNGNIEYILEASYDPITGKRLYPSGKYPRLIMVWMAKQIRRAGKRKTETCDPERHIIILPSVGALCDDLGLGHGGKTAQRVQEQFRLLLRSRISLRKVMGFKGADYHDIIDIPIAKETVFKESDTSAEFSGLSVMLTDEVWNKLATESAPFDMSAATALLSGRSVMPWDIYLWLVGSLPKIKRPMTITWKWLFDRFSNGSKLKNFKEQFKRSLNKALEAYPNANVEVVSEGLVLYPSRPVINKNFPQIETFIGKNTTKNVDLHSRKCGLSQPSIIRTALWQ